MVSRTLLVATLGITILSCSDATGPDDMSQIQIQAGREFTCAVDGEGIAWCWGRNNAGQLGDGTSNNQGAPARVRGERTFSSIGIAGTGVHACGVSDTGTAFCWGGNDRGQLGNGTIDDSSVPVAVAGSHVFRSVSAGSQFSCGVAVGGDGYCWGQGAWGNLGDGGKAQSLEPVLVAGNLEFSTLKAGSSSLACGVTTGGDGYCWGLNWRGEIGSTTGEQCAVGPFLLDCASTPARVPRINDEPFQDISPGLSYACGVSAGGLAACWGTNELGQLGNVTTEICIGGPGLFDASCSRTALPVFGQHRCLNIATGRQHTCGVTVTRQGLCWGLNDLGQLGNGVFRSQSTVPETVRGGHAFVSIAAGHQHSCGATAKADMYCWGTNVWGQVGNADALIQEFPILVVSGRPVQ